MINGRLEISRWAPWALVVPLACVTGLMAGIDPPVAIVFAAALAFALLAFMDLTAGLAAFILFVFLEAGSLGKVLIAATLVLLLAYIAHVSTDPEARKRTFLAQHRGAGYLLLAFTGWALVSTSWAVNSGDAFAELGRYALNVALFVIAYSAIQTRERAGWIIGAYLVGAGVISLLAPFLSVAGIGIGVAAEDTGDRLAGGIGDPNEFAALLIPAIAISIGAAAGTKNPALRVAALLSTGACLISFFLTASRGGLVGLAVALIAAVFLAGRWRLAALLGGLAVVVSAVAYFGLLAPADVRERIVDATNGETRASQESRLTIWQVGWRVVEGQPVLGVGIGNFADNSVRYVLEPGQALRSDVIIDAPLAAHNTYLHILAEMGIPGALMFIGLCAFCLASSLLAARRFGRQGDRTWELLSRALLIGQVGMLAAIFFFSAQSVNKVWLVLALGPGLLAIARSEVFQREGSTSASMPATSAGGWS